MSCPVVLWHRCGSACWWLQAAPRRRKWPARGRRCQQGSSDWFIPRDGGLNQQPLVTRLARASRAIFRCSPEPSLRSKSLLRLRLRTSARFLLARSPVYQSRLQKPHPSMGHDALPVRCGGVKNTKWGFPDIAGFAHRRPHAQWLNAADVHSANLHRFRVQHGRGVQPVIKMKPDNAIRENLLWSL